MSDAEILAAAKAWRNQDPDDETRAELDALLVGANHGSAEALDQLRDRFSTRLDFGTAGLRGALGAGPNRMNRVLVIQAAGGLAAFLLARRQHPSVVIGYDGRKNSREFAIDTAEVMTGAGVRAILLPRLLPTPVLAFAVRHRDVDAGVMVTASHNPAADNGYKVYLGGVDGGSQIVPPSDGEIATQIDGVAAGDIRKLPRSAEYEIAGEDVVDAYVDQTGALAHAVEPINFVYTAMHGVGWETANRVFASAGFTAPAVVTEQLQPDPNFPTVAFPNPEEPGALDLSFARAVEVGAELVIANDPDADRLAVGIPNASSWRRLSGNEVGNLLAWRSATRAKTGALACSIVSSPALSVIAEANGLQHIETLTGFKWISRAPNLVFGFEEALGYLVDPDIIRDKDGISAAVDFLGLASELKAAGKTIADHLEDFADAFGAYASSQISLRFNDLTEIPRVMNSLRASLPEHVGGHAVRQVDDFEHGFGGFGPNDILRIWMTDGSRVVVRPSGTEPKLKVYIDASSTDGTAPERMTRAQATVDRLDAGMRELLA
ncbi:MAG TPA: phospho-sugar mutase [Galbitalea sp.]|jgi:phosphomannomutase|nr:phospho-sugar mutase [Galbitalea sp.]